MNLITPVELPSGLPAITHAQQLLLLGSCFAENIGTQLSINAFRADVNPFGILYNPLSMACALREIQSGRIYTETDLFFYRECWHSPMHHGAFSGASATAVLEQINNRLQQAHKQLEKTDWLLLTWGTAYVYEQRTDGAVVSNCHKLPEKEFVRRCLTVDEIVAEYTSLLNDLRARSPHLKVLFTVSPIRHARDGMHANQLSKATLLLAIEQLQTLFCEAVFYFPSYEIMLDELRDYRFYADDMLHPSPLAVRYLWNRFATTLFTPETRTIMHEYENIRKALAHKPFHPDSEAHKRFLGQIVLKINRLNQKYPYLDFENERKRINASI
ncbi:GSCFA domain-containing protein [Bacteroides sp.]|uniref:GSCFA domain-containing protein n=1 Tax=Bacteroides sp. TaxID=29523 RepID=UPI001B7134C3|nr:GSCFA domain-containing protein [Bacteroides sp.]MBP6064867.1 GSCFA domain-containing protein [Bacteroides sp.]MBP6067720.1 GSCFA domain-containing protein [Bacteroides sp.]MBP6935670.1 GSCFA domain-containing protein [Bacteroides sp.]MBP8621524.1 GSCFA domain-containing protein [Bacteroides sp.]MBP9506925.1 GSCFA domain-containing protein [Bacteroides sp.]